MRIFVASSGLTFADGSKGLWAVNLVDVLRDMGHEVVVSSIDWDAPLDYIENFAADAAGRSERSDALLKEVARAHSRAPIRLFLSYFYSVHVEPEAVRRIKELGIPTVNFYCNGAHQFHLVSDLAPAFDYCWVPEQQALEAYRRVGAHPLHIQMGANPVFYRPLPGVSRDVKMSFTGTLYADRAMWLAKMLDHQLPVWIYSSIQPPAVSSNGNGSHSRSYWKEAAETLAHHGPMQLGRRAARMARSRMAVSRLAGALHPREADLARLFNRSDIVLNLSHVYDGGLPGGSIKAHVRLRDFEVPLCRALFFPQYSDELEACYDIRSEVVAWRTIEELTDLSRYYLAHPQEAEQIREAGYRRALAEHTAERRFTQLFQEAGLN